MQTALDGASITNSGTITTLSADAIHLVDTIGGAQPGAVLNTSTGIINAGGGNGIFAGGIAENGSITNSGTIAAFDSGVDVFARSVDNAAPESATGSIEPSALVANRGTILNTSGGTITSGSDGVRLFGENTGTVTNAGTITAGSSGIYVLGMGSGMPAGAPEAAAILEGPVVANSGQIRNSGTITAEYDGIYLRGENSGSVTNAGSITADEGLYVNGSTIETALEGDTVSVTRFANRGTVANAKDASLTTDYDAIVLRGENSGTVSNAGTIESQNGDGIYVNNSRRVIDTSAKGGAAELPIETSFAAAVANSGTIENTGSIVASDGTGMSIEGENAQGAQIVNAGTIEASEGIRAVTSMRRVYDTGSLEADIAEPAVDLSAAVANHGTITNAQTGSILTTSNGISLMGQNAATGVVSNAGQIETGPRSVGLFVMNAEMSSKMRRASAETETEPTRLVANLGLIENSATGTIIVGTSGIQSMGENAGTLRNAGRIEGRAGISVASAGIFNSGIAKADSEDDEPSTVYSSVANSGTIENVEGATIVASTAGMMLGGENTGTITNAGSITADMGVLGFAAYSITDGTVANSGTIANTATGKITADTSGLMLIGQNTGTVTNAGSIKVTTGNGIDVTNDLSVLSGLGAGAPLGDIAETTWVANTGTIENVAGGTIDAEWDGIHANGRNAGTISNAGTIKAGAAGIDVASVFEKPMLGAATVAPGDAEAASVMNSGAIVNSGTIEAAIAAVSVRGDNTGSISNLASGTMSSGTSSAVLIDGDNSGTVTNAGSIVSRDYDGIAIRGANSGTIRNTATGSVTSVYPAVTVRGDNTGLIENAGQLTSTNIASVYVMGANAKDITNAATGTITSTDGNGISVMGRTRWLADAPEAGEAPVVAANSGTITNAGSIKAGASGILVGTGVRLLDGAAEAAELEDSTLANSGTIANAAGASIEAGETGILAAGGNSGTITNAGSIKAGEAGISAGLSQDFRSASPEAITPESTTLANSGTITNAAGASIEAGSTGILAAGENSGTITNAGSIKAESIGVLVGSESLLMAGAESDDAEPVPAVTNSGTITNAAGATIDAGTVGVLVAGENAGTVANAGNIKATAGIAVLADNSGTITNTGHIEAVVAGALIAANSGTFTNALGASIVAESVGVFISGDSEILTNAGDITAGSAGFVVGGDATTLQNSGNITVTATNARAISVAGSATTLDNSGTITSAGHGIMVAGDVGSFTNSGTITTTGGENTAAVRVLGKVTGSVLNSGTVSSNAGGVEIIGAVAGDVTNTGKIEAVSTGLAFVGAGTGNLVNSGTIVATESAALQVGGSIKDITNSGTISGTAGVMVFGEVTGALTNSGTITATGADGGINVSGSVAGAVTNSGTITAAGSGVIVSGSVGGDLTNSGTVSGKTGGVVVEGDVGAISNSGTITAAEAVALGVIGKAKSFDNSGKIAGVNGVALLNEVSGSVVNSGTIEADKTGMFFTVAADVTNSGTIKAADGGGMSFLAVKGDVTNSGTIQATGGGGMSFLAAEGDVTNSGTIEATGGDGIAFWGAADLINSGTISSSDVGINALSVQSVTNSGTISGASGILAGGIAGDLTNTGTISGTTAGVAVQGGVEGAFNNSGTISALNNGAVPAPVAVAVELGGNVKSIANSGTISGTSGILVGGSVSGAVTNSGTITAIAPASNLQTGAAEFAPEEVPAPIGLGVAGSIEGDLTNSGSITATGGVGAQVDGDVKSVTNSGTIKATNGVVLAGTVNGNVTNSGTIDSIVRGIEVQTANEVVNTGTIAAAGAPSTTNIGIYAKSVQSVSNSGTITASSNNARGIYTEGSAVVTNHGTVSASGADSAAIVLAGDAQTLINSGSIASDNLAIASNGGDRVVFAAPSASSGAVGQVTGAIASSGADSTLYFGAAHDVTASSDLLASRADNFRMSYGGSITNFGAVFLAGTTDLTGASQFNPSAVLAGAKLSANGTLEFSGSAPMPAGVTLPATAPASVQLYNAGTLGGNGTLRLRSADGGLGTLLNTGTLAPGNSIGHLTVDGNVAHSGALDIEVNPAASGAPVAGVDYDLLSIRSGVSGETATFTFAAGSTVNFVATSAAGESLPGTVYNFISADSSAKIVIEGTSVAVNQLLVASDNLPDYTFYVVSDETNMSDLRNLYAVAARDHTLDKFTINESQGEMGRFISSNANNETMKELATNLALTPGNAELNQALERLSGEIYPSLVSLEQDRASDVMRNVAANLRPTSVAASAEVGARPVWSTFGEMTGAKGEYDDGNVAELDRTYYGALAGVDCKLSSRLNVGGFVNVADGKVDNHHPDRADFTAFDVGLYGRYNREGDYYYASLSYGVADYDVTRQAAVARTSALSSQPAVVTSADVDSSQFTALFEKGYTFKLGERHYLQPYAAFQFSQVCFDSFTEKNGGALGLRVDLDDYTSVLGSLGVAWQYDFNGMLAARVHAAWSHECDEEQAEMEATFAGANGTYHLKGLELGEDRFNFGLGLDAQVSDRLLTYVRGDYTVSDGKSAVSGQAGVRYSW